MRDYRGFSGGGVLSVSTGVLISGKQESRDEGSGGAVGSWVVGGKGYACARKHVKSEGLYENEGNCRRSHSWFLWVAREGPGGRGECKRVREPQK